MIKAFIFGFTLALSVGPIALIILNNGIQHGHAVAIRSAFGAAVADFIFASIAFISGVILLSALTEHKVALTLISSTTLILFGIYMIWIAARNSSPGTNTEKKVRPIGFRGTFILTIVNPLTIIAFSAFLGQSSPTLNVGYSIKLAFSVFLGSLLVQVLLALFGASLQNILRNSSAIKLLQLLSGIGIATFGLFGLLM